MIRCKCGALHEQLRPYGVQEVEEREYAELAACPKCGTTLCTRTWRLTSSSNWRVSSLPNS
ncbi:MAG TPA: hypothetical protein VGY54_28230 [Polyangiaceae bacterium]|jgi:hypothetical protein|nr:hypothetical protein [Polyangiaceae bacterium]